LKQTTIIRIALAILVSVVKIVLAEQANKSNGEDERPLPFKTLKSKK